MFDMHNILEHIQNVIRLHDGQKRKVSNEPYVCHPIRVLSLVNSEFDNEEICLGALYHDVLEDCSITPNKLEKEIYDLGAMRPALIVEIVEHLTLLKGEKKIDAIKRLGYKNVPYECIIIKMADMIDNYEVASKDKIEKNRPRAIELHKIYEAKHFGVGQIFHQHLCHIFNIEA